MSDHKVVVYLLHPRQFEFTLAIYCNLVRGKSWEIPAHCFLTDHTFETHRRDGDLSAEVVHGHHGLLLEALVVKLARALRETFFYAEHIDCWGRL